MTVRNTPSIAKRMPEETSKMRTPLLRFIVLFWILILTCGCENLNLFKPSTYFPEETSGESVVFLPNTNPDNVLSNLITCYNHRNIEHYDSLLAPDYRFYMSTSLRGYYLETNEIPDARLWTPDFSDSTHLLYYIARAQDLENTRKMFDPSGQAKEISLDFQFIQANEGTDTLLYFVSSIVLTVTLRDNTRLTTASPREIGYAHVHLVRGSDNRWRIWRWFDGTAGEGDKE